MTALSLFSDRSTLLRRVLWTDAATCVAMGLLLSLFARTLSPALGLPSPLLLYAGLALFPIAGFIAWVATRSNRWTLGVWLVIAGNALWVAASAVVLVSGWVSPTLLGHAFVIAQAVVVALLAELEYVALRRA